MLKKSAISVLALLILFAQGYTQTQKTPQGTKSDLPLPAAASITPQQNDRPTFSSEHEKHVVADVRVVSNPQKDRYDLAVFWANMVLAGVGIGGIIVALVTLGKIKNQAGEMKTQSGHMERQALLASTQAVIMERQAVLLDMQTQIQESSMTQWIDLEPDGLFTEADTTSPEIPERVTINPRWKIVNNTPLPFTIETIEVHVERGKGWEVSVFQVDQVIPPIRNGQSPLTFFAPTLLTKSETKQFLDGGIELSMMIGVVYIGASGKQERQSFGDFYVCRIGKLDINHPIGKGPQNQRIEKYDTPSTLVSSHKRILENEQKSQ